MRTNNSPRLGVTAGVALTAVAVLGLAGCGHSNNGTVPSSGSPTSSTAAPTTSSTGSQFDIGNTINYASMGTTTTLDCGDGKSLNVGGSNNTLTIKGTCGTVTVGGADNKITIDKIDTRLNIVGVNNTVSYKAGEPKVENLGSGNTINKAG